MKPEVDHKYVTDGGGGGSYPELVCGLGPGNHLSLLFHRLQRSHLKQQANASNKTPLRKTELKVDPLQPLSFALLYLKHLNF